MSAAAYRVLARKYRPVTFAELIGQDAVVRTLSNAIRMGRIAQAFILTGARGVGKTTTARLIARALNCIGPDGAGGATVDPCGQCANCRAIAEDRHPDVIEMDAASRTGVDNIRELIDGVPYLPVQARYKVYILDEVHMLSEKAFNALLKTLEEPPRHVKFVFCTTEIRKVPVTVLSRCQRFDLRRVEANILIAHLGAIAAKEGVAVAPEALALIARAAEGSVRDALSLLDQAIAHGPGGEAALSVTSGAQSAPGEVTAGAVRAMLGLGDRGQTFDLFGHLARGEVAAALAALRQQYEGGVDPLTALQDLLDLVHWLTRIKIVPAAGEDVTLTEAERRRAKAMADELSLPVLARAWQILLKGLGEVRAAPSPIAAAEMALVRLAYVAAMPTPAEIIAELDAPSRTQGASAAPAAPMLRPSPALASRQPEGLTLSLSKGEAAPAAPRGNLAPQAAMPAAAPGAQPGALADPATFEDVVALFGENREIRLKAELMSQAHLVRFEPGRIELRFEPGTPINLAASVQQKLGQWTGRRWVVVLSNETGQPTLTERAAASRLDRESKVMAHPLVRAALAAFPGAELAAVRALAAVPGDQPGGDAPGDPRLTNSL
jgi:DNA polymerase III subunit gamma/tau